MRQFKEFDYQIICQPNLIFYQVISYYRQFYSSMQKLQIHPTIEQTLRNPLNNSSSKFQYSFYKAERFRRNSKTEQSNYHFYDIPSTKSKRAASIGSGKKCAFIIRNPSNPPPNAYNLHGQFEEKKFTGGKFGLSRDQIKAVQFLRIIDNPGPGSYNPNPQITESKISIAYSLSKQVRRDKLKTQGEKPGPGSYQIKSPLFGVGKILSTNKNYGCPVMVKQRIRKLKTEQNGDFLIMPKLTIKGEQLGFGSKGFSISKSKRWKDQKGVTSYMPGPGSYVQFSQFIHGKK